MRFAYVLFAAAMLACVAPVGHSVPEPEAKPSSPTPSQPATKADLAKILTDDERRELAERAEALMFQYELDKAEYHAASKLRFGRIFFENAKRERAAGHADEADRLTAKAAKWFREVIDLYGETETAGDARLLLDGKPVPARRVPPPPIPPVIVRTTDDDAREAVAFGKPGTPIGIAEWSAARTAGRSVYVRDYTRRDGTYVHAHFRAPPGGGRR